MQVRLLAAEFELQDNKEYALSSLVVDGQATDFKSLFNSYEDITYYVNNLNMLYIYLLKYAVDNKIEIEYAYKNGKCTSLNTKYEPKIQFVNFKSKFGCEFSANNETNKKLIEYAYAKHRTRKTLGADAYNEFLHTIFKPKEDPNANYNLIRENFPIFEYSDMLQEAKKNVYGFQFVKPGRYQNIYNYDISGSYPAAALNNHPVGLPHFYNSLEETPASYFKIIKFTYYECSLKPGGLNFICVGKSGHLVLSQRLFDLFKENYNAVVHIKQIEAYKTRKSMFSKFINQTIIHGKSLETDPVIARYNKNVGNAIIGYLGRNCVLPVSCYKVEQERLILYQEEKQIDPIYLPAYVNILDAAKTRFLRSIKPFANAIIYANTDGILTTKPLPLEILNLSNTNPLLGNFRECSKFLDIEIKCINGYAGITADGEVDNTISGMSLEQFLTPEQYASNKFTYYMNEPTPHGTIKRTAISL